MDGGSIGAPCTSPCLTESVLTGRDTTLTRPTPTKPKCPGRFPCGRCVQSMSKMWQKLWRTALGNWNTGRIWVTPQEKPIPLGQVRPNTQAIFVGAPENHLYQPADQREAEQASGGDSADRPAPDGGAGGEDSPVQSVTEKLKSSDPDRTVQIDDRDMPQAVRK